MIHYISLNANYKPKRDNFMKKKLLISSSIIIFILILIITTIAVIYNNNEKVIKEAIGQTKQFITEKEFSDSTFPFVLQTNLNDSLVYNTNENEYTIIYKNKTYVYKNNKLKKSKLNYTIYDDLNSAIDDNNIGKYVFTKGYYTPFDGGNAYYKIDNYTEDKSIISYSDTNKTHSLVYTTYDSIINTNQMGYNGDKSVDYYINQFTTTLSYNNIVLSKGTYTIKDNFDINVSNKNYYSIDAKLFSDDTYSPTGYNNGCLFYVYNNISNVTINGFNLEVKVNKKLDDPLLGLCTARNVDGLTINNCSFYLPEEAHIYGSSGILDLFTAWKNVIVKNCRLENHASTVAGGGIGIRDIYEQKCENALFENNYLYCNCRDEIIAIFSGVDTSLGYVDGGNGNIENVTFKNNTIIGDPTNLDYTTTPRVVGITIGYQKSPVKNINFINNNINMYSANYFLLYGKADTVNFENNNIKIDCSYKEKLYKLICHNSKADSGYNIKFNNNNVEFINDSTLNTISETGEEFTFANNTLKGVKVYRLFDSKSTFKYNNINFDRIEECVYRNIKKVNNNTINTQFVNVVYEFFNLNITDNIIINSDIINVNTMACNFMMFNGSSINFNNHTVTFNNFRLNTNNVDGKYYYLAYGTQPIQDTAIINFYNCTLSMYNNDGHNKVIENNTNGETKVTINFVNN